MTIFGQIIIKLRDTTVHLTGIVLFLWKWFARHKKIRFAIILVVSFFYCLFKFASAELAMEIIMRLAMLMYGFVFMIIQFWGIFWYLGKPKTTTILPGDEKRHTWADYWGNHEIKALVKDWMKLLTAREEFDAMGGQPIRGWLLAGPPGTGKTFLMECCAGQEGVAFHSVAGSGFRGMFWGVDILRVIDFKNKIRGLAKEWGMCIGYIDEIDALGSRGGLLGGTMKFLQKFLPEKWAEKMVAGLGGMGSGALNQLLKEIDGIEQPSLMDQCQNQIRRWCGLPELDQGVIVFVGGTNKPELIDGALKRSGRLDKEIYVDKPDRASRREIIQGYLNTIEHDPEICVEDLVSDLTGSTPADIKFTICADAVKNAIFDNSGVVTQRHIEDAYQERKFGLENPISEMSEWQRKIIAIHEAGHAVTQFYVEPEKRIIRATIVRRGAALGYIMHVDKEDIYLQSGEFIARRLYVALGGPVAAHIHTGQHWSGDAGDMRHIKFYLYALAKLGYFGFAGILTEIDPTKPGQLPKELIETADIFMQRCQKQVELLLREKWSDVEKLSNALLEKHSLSGNEVRTLLENK